MASADAKLDPARTAIVCIEFQNEFTTPGGVLHDAVKGVMESTNMLDNTVALVEEARKKGVMIMHVPITFTDDYKELKAPYGILGNVKAAGAFKASGWGGAICDKMKPQPSDVVVEGKRGLCGFKSTNLEFILRHAKVEAVALAGFLTNCCVESTMRAAYEDGFDVYTLKDCCAATSQEAHDAAISHTFPMFSKPVTSGEFLGMLP